MSMKRAPIWTKEEIAKMQAMYDAGASLKAIAEALGRTEQAVATKRWELGITRRRRGFFSHTWKGGRRITAQGYVEVFRPNHPRARGNGYVFEHILVAERKLGRRLRPGEVVHHIDGNKQNNDPDNLAVMTQGEHTRIHTKKPRPVPMTCAVCGGTFFVKPSHVPKRKTCGRQCAGVLFRRYYTGKPRDYRPTQEGIA